MINPNVAWHKYLNSSNPIINKYLNTFGDEFFQKVDDLSKSAIKTAKPKFLTLIIVPAILNLYSLTLSIEHFETNTLLGL